MRKKILAGFSASVVLVGISACAAFAGASNDAQNYPAYPSATLVPYPDDEILSESDAEVQRLLREDAYWQSSVASMYPDAVKPVAEFTGYVEQGQHVNLLAECFADAGVPHEANEAGSAVMANPLDQSQAVSAFLCNVQIQPVISRMTEEQLGWYHDYWSTVFLPCYAAHGLTPNGAGGEFPSRSGYIEQRMANSIDPRVSVWYPYFDTDRVAPEALRALEDRCPFDPLAE